MNDDIKPYLSVCVIGRNEAAGISRCALSLSELQALGCGLETIYVDSASSDASVATAIEHFDKVLVLEPSEHLNASAGRYIGTLEARGDWIVYLDGDMTLSPAFLPYLRDLIAGRFREGISGHTQNVYPDGTVSYPLAGYNRSGRSARVFGGACVLSRGTVLASGNWNPRLYSNEEAELYGRMRRIGATVIWTDEIMVNHHTPRISRLAMLRGLMFPRGSVLGKKYFGLGQVARSGALGMFLTVRSDGLLFMVGTFLSLLMALCFPVAGVLALAATVATAILLRGISAPIVYASWVPQILLGLSRYPSDYVPIVSERLEVTKGPNV